MSLLFHCHAANHHDVRDLKQHTLLHYCFSALSVWVHLSLLFLFSVSHQFVTEELDRVKPPVEAQKRNYGLNFFLTGENLLY